MIETATYSVEVMGLIFSDGRVENPDNEAPMADVLKPMGLSGTYVVTGLAELRYDADEKLRRVHAPFEVTLAPTSTAMSVLCEAAKVHKAMFGDGDHHFCESFEVNGRTIELGMGS